MKKSLLVVCTALVLLACFAFTGCSSCEHEFGQWEYLNGSVSDCTEDQELQRVCTKCGVVEFSTEAGKPHEEVKSYTEKNRGAISEIVTCKNCPTTKTTSNISFGDGITFDSTSPKNAYVFAYTFSQIGNYTCVLDAGGNENVEMKLYICENNACEAWLDFNSANGRMEFPVSMTSGTTYFMVEINNPNDTEASVTFEIFKDAE